MYNVKLNHVYGVIYIIQFIVYNVRTSSSSRNVNLKMCNCNVVTSSASLQPLVPK